MCSKEMGRWEVVHGQLGLKVAKACPEKLLSDDTDTKAVYNYS